MDDQQTYLLNGLLTRNFDLGRISRFRNVARGRQTETFEILTAEHHEYVVYLYPPTYAPEQLEFVARTINMLDEHRFSVVPMLQRKDDPAHFSAEGPQGGTMLVGLATAGSAIPADQYTDHDISQVGLRLAWLHRLLKEQLAPGQSTQSLPVRLVQCVADPEFLRLVPFITSEMRDRLLWMLQSATPRGFAHGDIQPAAMLLDSDHQIRMLIDFGLLHEGCPLEDLVDALLSLCMDSAGTVIPARGRALLEAYDSLQPIKATPWTNVVAVWCAQRIVDAPRRPVPKNLSQVLAAPERLGAALASCL
jgi:Ser/Thr protein kinase RdoA (MazF antagonist)